MRPIRPGGMDAAPSGSAGRADQPITSNTGDATMCMIYRSVMPQSATESAAWDSMGLDAAFDRCRDAESTRYEWPSDEGDSSGEVFATLENYQAPDGCTYNILFMSSWCSSYAPWTDTNAIMYDTADPAEMAEYARDVARWEAAPEIDPDYPTDDDDDDSGPDDSPPVPSGWESIDGGGSIGDRDRP